MALSDIVTLNITSVSTAVDRAGFGVPIIVAPAADCPGDFTERVRFYTDLDGVKTDFAADTVTRDMAAQMFAQNPRPSRIAVGRLEGNPTQAFTITPTATALTEYGLTINGTHYAITSDGSTSPTEICDALRTAISEAGVTEGGTTTLTLTSGTAGHYMSVKADNTLRLKVVQTTADTSGIGLENELDAIALEDSSWYVILWGFNSKACAEILSDWAEDNEKLYLAASNDSDIENLSATSDYNSGTPVTIAGSTKKDAKARTAILYKRDNGEFADAAWAGRVLPYDAGSETWALKTLANVSPDSMTATQRTNVLAKYANLYERVGGTNNTNNGTVAANEYIDIIRGKDAFTADVQADVFGSLRGNATKLPFTDEGIAAVEAAVRKNLKKYIDLGFFSASPAPTVRVPKAADVSSSDRAARRLTGVKFDATYASAIQSTTISGQVSI